MKNCILLTFVPFFLAFDASAQDQPLPPREAPLHMTLPEGFKATLFAGEPDVVQPIAMCFDQRGRLWVAECMSYPGWLADPKKGRDRILIFEDTDGDGVFDKRTVFMDKLANVTAVQVGFGGVYVGATPYLLFIPDKNGDDVPDGPPEVVLDGFDIKTGHTAMNSLTWGPDGWLYGCHGIQAVIRIGTPGTPKDKRPVMDCGVWRYHPVRKEVEVFAHGTTNPWGLDFDEHGQMFITNCVIGHLWHVVPGAHFERMYGQDLNPHVYGLLKTCADHRHWGSGSWTTSRATKVGPKEEHSDAGGGHAHVGCMVYLGDNFPERYRNGVFMCNLHGNRINHDILERQGSSYVARHGKDFMFANDPWFRGIALCYGPDGAVYVSDWTDTGECHNYKVVDQTNGRIYKISYGTPKNPAETFGKNWDLSKLPDSELVKLQTHKNEWYVRTARRILQERAAAGTLAKETRAQLAKNFLESVALDRLRLFWALHAIDGLDQQSFRAASTSYGDEYLRAWCLQLYLEKRSKDPEKQASVLRQMAEQDPSSVVRLAVASGLQRLPPKMRFVTAQSLVFAREDSQDPYLPLMLWYAIEPAVAAEPYNWAILLPTSPLLREYAARRITLSGEKEKAFVSLVDQLTYNEEPPLQRDVLRGIQAGLDGRRQVPMPKEWQNAYPKLVQSPLAEVRDLAVSLAVKFGDQRAFATLERIVKDRKEPALKRQKALEAVLFQQKADVVPTLQNLLDEHSMRAAAIKGLARFDDQKTPDLILGHYGALTSEEKADAVHTLTSRPPYARALLDAMEKKLVPRQDVSAFNARQIQALGSKDLVDTLTKVWGAIRPASEEKAGLMKKYKGALTPDYLKKANLARGRLLYQKTCAACHRLFDDGGNIGPELTGSQRANLDYLLENMLDPSAIVAKDYQVSILTTTSGRVLTGIVKQQNDKAVTVQTQNELIVLPKEDIDSRTQSPLSIMPEGQLDPLTMDQVRDLVGYLASPVQVPLAEKK
jgi:putative membrane-bound dehydrogenase-like protein